MAGPTFLTPFRLAAVALAILAINSATARQAVPAPAATAPPAVKTAPAPAAIPVKPLWKELSKPQQLVLAPLAGEWDVMELTRKQKWLDVANRYAAMKPDEQLRVQERMREWVKLTPEERRTARENYTKIKKIDKSKKQDSWNEYQQLSDEQKKKLAADAAAAAAAAKKQVTALPPKAQAKALAPIKPAAPCPAGTVANATAATPACVPVLAPPPAAVTPAVPAAVPAPVPAAVPATAPVTTPPITPPGNPAAPVPNAK